MAKKVPNPNGKKGGELHKSLQTLLKKQLEDEYENEPTVNVRTEISITTLGGIKDARIVDVAAFELEEKEKLKIPNWKCLIQVGKTNAKGQPIKREQEAINDIEMATGIEVEFYDYETKQKIK